MIQQALLPLNKAAIKIAFALSFLFLCAELKAQSSGIVLKGRLLFARTANAAKGYQVILVANTSANDQITASPRFYGDNNRQLQTMGAQLAFTGSDGVYYFKGLQAGRYILKVCTPNGYKYNFIIANNNNKLMTIKDLPTTFETFIKQ